MEKGPPPAGTLFHPPAQPLFMFFIFHSRRDPSGFFNRLLRHIHCNAVHPFSGAFTLALRPGVMEWTP
jgi:hypothetical protein